MLPVTENAQQLPHEPVNFSVLTVKNFSVFIKQKNISRFNSFLLFLIHFLKQLAEIFQQH